MPEDREVVEWDPSTNSWVVEDQALPDVETPEMTMVGCGLKTKAEDYVDALNSFKAALRRTEEEDVRTIKTLAEKKLPPLPPMPEGTMIYQRDDGMMTVTYPSGKSYEVRLDQPLPPIVKGTHPV